MPRDDSLIQQDIIAELRLDQRIAAVEVGVAVRGGVATLSGTAESANQKDVILKAARRVIGVQAIADELRVLEPGGVNRTDTEIAHAVLNALNWEPEAPRGGVTARVDEGWVWLDGDVGTQQQSDAAQRAVGFVMGVRGVTNVIRVQQAASALPAKPVATPAGSTTPQPAAQFEETEEIC